MVKTVYSIYILIAMAFIGNVFSSIPINSTRGGNDNKIVGGYNVTIQQYPYQAFLLLYKGRDTYRCGGSIISSRIILTAAHCFTLVTRLEARVGSADAYYGGWQYTAMYYISHPWYNSQTFDYDVGYAAFQNIYIDGVNTRIISLAPSGSDVAPGTILYVAGWGRTSEYANVSDTLLAVQVPVVSDTECRRYYKNLTPRMICAAWPEGGRSACRGDSGGATVSYDGIQRGIVSNSYYCAVPGFPEVFTKVSSVRSWITYMTGV